MNDVEIDDENCSVFHDSINNIFIFIFIMNSKLFAIVKDGCRYHHTLVQSVKTETIVIFFLNVFNRISMNGFRSKSIEIAIDTYVKLSSIIRVKIYNLNKLR